MKKLLSRKGKSAKKEPDPNKIEITQHYDDRLIQYIIKQLRLSPLQYFRQVRMYWAAGIALNVIAVGFMVTSVYQTQQANAAVEVRLVRVDGKSVKESFDVRRSVLMKNSLQRAALRGQGN